MIYPVSCETLVKLQSRPISLSTFHALFAWPMSKTNELGSFCGLSWRFVSHKANPSTTEPSSPPNKPTQPNASTTKPSSISANEPCQRFSLAAIQKATNNFDNASFVGEGRLGNLYKGYIDGRDTMVSIKRYYPGSGEEFQQEQNRRMIRQMEYESESEVDILSKLRHPNLVSLIGYCHEEDEMILVFDYMTNGTLLDHLHGKDGANRLPWKQRLEICIGAAKGLHFLHTGAKKTIIHRDVKTANISLDENWVAKISNFGLSLRGPSGMPNTAVSNEVLAGTMGYVDPEYLRQGILTEKIDVYAFGVVLFEVLSARKAFSPEASDKDQVKLADWAQKCIRDRTIDELIDPSLIGKVAPVCLKKFVGIGKSCLRDNGTKRPMMRDVVEGLEFALQLQESADAAANKEINFGDEPHNVIYRGMSFGDSERKRDLVPSQSGRVLSPSNSEQRSPSFDSDYDIWEVKEESHATPNPNPNPNGQ